LCLARDVAASTWMRAHGILVLALLTNYMCSALFHDLTLMPSQAWLLFVFAGLAVTLRQEAFQSRPLSSRPECRRRASFAIPRTPNAVPLAASPDSNVHLFGMKLSRVTMHETVEQLLEWCAQPSRGACRYVVTPNVDHAVLFQSRDDLRRAYADASLVLADGTPIVLASRLLGRQLPERVAGSDLVPRLFESSKHSLRVFLLGAAPGVAERAAGRIGVRWNNVQVVGTYSPPPGFEHDDAENARILAAIAAAAPDLLIVGLGAPKQELWVHRHRHRLRAKVALCAGATIDFLAGHRRRSPVWMRRVGLEWLHRVCSEPRRLAVRYARDAWVFPQLVWREWRGTRLHRVAGPA
jgi:N-acetylglucosaminyldiphosphoundecaprenol N-acetyl-beta-D-mannosaminyltransferase